VGEKEKIEAPKEVFTPPENIRKKKWPPQREKKGFKRDIGPLKYCKKDCEKMPPKDLIKGAKKEKKRGDPKGKKRRKKGEGKKNPCFRSKPSLESLSFLKAPLPLNQRPPHKKPFGGERAQRKCLGKKNQREDFNLVSRPQRPFSRGEINPFPQKEVPKETPKRGP